MAISKVSENLYYKDYSCTAQSFSAANPGVYIGYQEINAEVTGKTIIGYSIIKRRVLTTHNVCPYIENNNIVLVFYSAQNSAVSVSADDIRVRVFYK